jgi:hypothetical protein
MHKKGFLRHDQKSKILLNHFHLIAYTNGSLKKR